MKVSFSHLTFFSDIQSAMDEWNDTVNNWTIQLCIQHDQKWMIRMEE